MSIVKEYEEICGKVARHFGRRYFGTDIESYWIANEIGGCYYINDRFFNVGDMIDYIKYHYTPEQMFEYYDYSIACKETGQTEVNIKNYKKLKIK